MRKRPFQTLLILLVVLLFCLLILFFPHKQTVSYSGTALEYSAQDAGYAVSHAITIEGIYIYTYAGKGNFQGTFLLSGLSDDKVEQVSITFANHIGTPTFYDEYGQPITTKIYRMILNRGSSEAIIELYDEYSEDAGKIAAVYSGDKFVYLGNQARSEAVELLNSFGN